MRDEETRVSFFLLMAAFQFFKNIIEKGLHSTQAFNQKKKKSRCNHKCRKSSNFANKKNKIEEYL